MSLKSNAYPVAISHQRLRQYNNLGRLNRWKPQYKRLYRKCPMIAHPHTVRQLALAEVTSSGANQEEDSQDGDEEH
jgi:hypothetical protein